MNFSLEEAIGILERTPRAMEVFLKGLSSGWLECNEGEGTWNVSEVVEHLIECEKTNWIPRIESIFNQTENHPFPPFDRFAHLKKADRTIDEKLIEFSTLRSDNIKKLTNLIQSENDLTRIGSHPEFGEVKLSELISTWVVHDFSHLTQIVRVMAKSYQDDVGPWVAYLGVLNRPL